jgi:hypothetical protein
MRRELTDRLRPEALGDRGGLGEATDAAHVGEAARVIAEHTGAEDGPEPGHAGDDRSLGVLVEGAASSTSSASMARLIAPMISISLVAARPMACSTGTVP